VFSLLVWFAALSITSTSPALKNLDAITSLISKAKISAFTVDFVMRYQTGVDRLDIPHILMIKHVLPKSGSVIVGGTIPVKGSCRANLLHISFPFKDFLSAYFNRLGLILASAFVYSTAFSTLRGLNLL
jgi:hypothetical protein